MAQLARAFTCDKNEERLLTMSYPRVIGLDIGTRVVKLVEVHRSRKQLQLSYVGCCPLPYGVIVEKEIQQPEELANAVMSLYRNSKSKTTNVCLSVAGKSIITKQISLNSMSDQELEKLIAIEAEPYIPFPMEDVNLDFVILGDSPDRPGFMEVLLVAAKKDFLSQYVDLVTSLNLTPVVVDVDCYALEVMFEYCYPDIEDETVALINVGASLTNINILTAGKSHFVRDLPLGGDLVTRDIMRFFNVDFIQAENIKRGARLGNISPTNLKSLIDRNVEMLVAELKKTLEFFSINIARKSPQSIFLSGGGASLYGLSNTLETETGLPVFMVDPFRLVSADTKQFDSDYLTIVGPSMAIAFGLSMRHERDKLE